MVTVCIDVVLWAMRSAHLAAVASRLPAIDSVTPAQLHDGVTTLLGAIQLIHTNLY